MLTDQQIDIFNQHFQLTEIATEVNYLLENIKP